MIELEGLTRAYQVGDQLVKALDRVDLRIEPGEYISVMGPSGSGKSTLLHILGMLDRQTDGIYRIEGRDVSNLDDDERARIRGERIGFVFQFFHLVPRLSAAENIELPLTLAGMRPAERRERVDSMLESVGLTDRARHLPNQLSGGQRQRVAIARAMVTHPAVLLADEPTGNLDSASGAEIVNLLEGLNDQGITLLLVTHDTAMGKRARRYVRMVDGRIESDRVAGEGAP
ncbi:ABC transporter ATP-binding protein [Ectothiorhodospiraceae bacterium WFHF3C12]|nr:ABC transporter ATP-binding protein [Ectothiorhodospiraceae bacterium WFHF3C12]